SLRERAGDRGMIAGTAARTFAAFSKVAISGDDNHALGRSRFPFPTCDSDRSLAAFPERSMAAPVLCDCPPRFGQAVLATAPRPRTRLAGGPLNPRRGA